MPKVTVMARQPRTDRAVAMGDIKRRLRTRPGDDAWSVAFGLELPDEGRRLVLER